MLNTFGNTTNMQEPEEDWLADLVTANPHGVMKVLSVNGYTGYLAPQNTEELYEAAIEFIHVKGDDAVVALLRAHPLYDIIAGISAEERSMPVRFKNADGSESSIITTIKSINYKKLAGTLLMVIGAMYLFDKLFNSFKE